MDERRPDAEEQSEARSPQVETPAAPKPAVPPEVFLPPSSGKEAWRSGSGCGPRMRVYLFALAAVILIAVLFAGLSVLRRGVWASLEQGRTAVVRGLPPDLPPGERERTTRNLERFRSLLDRVDDPYPLMGELMRRVRAAFADGRLEKHEVEELNLFLEGVIEEAGVPALQLGFRISNFEFRISARPTAGHRGPSDQQVNCSSLNRIAEIAIALNRQPTNSKFEIRNSKFSQV